MQKFVILLLLFIGSSFFVAEAFSLEIEFQKESERIIDSMGWTVPEKLSYQEQIQIMIDHTELKNRISISMVSTDPNDIRFPDYLEALSSNPKILSFTLTNQFACEPERTDLACIIIEVEREGLGGDVVTIKKNAREITDKVVDQGIIVFAPEFSSITVKPKSMFDGSEKIVVEAKYTITKQPTDRLFHALSTVLVSSDIRTSGGFYDHAVKLSEHEFADMSMTLIPTGDNMLRGLHVALSCSNKLPGYINCPDHINEQIKNNKVNPLEFIQTENLNRSEVFADEFLPLNSIVHILVFSEQDIQVKSVNSNIIQKLQHLGDVQENGWFFTSKSGKKIDARYLFGQDVSVSKNNLEFSVGDNTGTEIEMREGGGCLIATAAFGSELSPQVQFLREIRDGKVMTTQSGSAFMNGFNQIYYSFSPTVADYERENPVFKEVVKTTLTPLLTSLALLNYVDIDSEHEMFGYGIGIILLNIGMYFVAPVVLIVGAKKLVKLNN